MNLKYSDPGIITQLEDNTFGIVVRLPVLTLRAERDMKIIWLELTRPS